MTGMLCTERSNRVFSFRQKSVGSLYILKELVASCGEGDAGTGSVKQLYAKIIFERLNL